MAITVNGAYPTGNVWSLGRLFVQLFGAHPDHAAHDQTLEGSVAGGIWIRCSCGVQVTVPRNF